MANFPLLYYSAFSEAISFQQRTAVPQHGLCAKCAGAEGGTMSHKCATTSISVASSEVISNNPKN